MPYYKYSRPAVTVDAVLFRTTEQGREILLIQRKNEPCQGCWALPGGFVDENESLVDAACRELEEETCVADVELSQFRAYGDPGRDPRGHTISVVFTGDVTGRCLKAVAMDDAKAVEWFAVSALPEMAFDHGVIVTDVLKAKEQE